MQVRLRTISSLGVLTLAAAMTAACSASDGPTKTEATSASSAGTGGGASGTGGSGGAGGETTSVSGTGGAGGSTTTGTGGGGGAGGGGPCSPDPTCGAAWEKHYVATNEVVIDDLAADAHGNIVIFGGVCGTTDFGAGPVTSTEFCSDYLTKLDPFGNPLWTKLFSVHQPVFAGNSAGETVVVGRTSGGVGADFGLGPVNTGGAPGAVVAGKFDASGSPVWHVAITGTDVIDCWPSVAIDGTGNVAITGCFSGTLDVAGSKQTSQGGGKETFLVSFDAAGNHVFSKRFGSPGKIQYAEVGFHASGDLLLSSTVSGTVDFAPHQLTSAGWSNMAVTRVAPSGDVLSAKQYGGASGMSSSQIEGDGADGALVAGFIVPSGDFGVGPLDKGVFIGRVDGSGAPLWARGGYEFTNNMEVAAVGKGGAVAAGGFWGADDFGGGVIQPSGGSDIFVLRFAPDGTQLPTVVLGEGGEEMIGGVTVDGADRITVGYNTKGEVGWEAVLHKIAP